mmetsp:Transcript_28326/g.94136  ORF Transcript_28326/g.94136 Transcript_28326/m.94136 type:complete len:94 (-) Transcript_28326:16-297(-)
MLTGFVALVALCQLAERCTLMEGHLWVRGEDQPLKRSVEMSESRLRQTAEGRCLLQVMHALNSEGADVAAGVTALTGGYEGRLQLGGRLHFTS